MPTSSTEQQKQTDAIVQTFVGTWAGYTSRWAQLVWWDRGNLERLHRRENSRSKQFSASGAVVEDPALMAQINVEEQLVPYWSREIDEVDRQTRMEIFKAQIYPIWAGLVRKAIEAELADERACVEGKQIRMNPARSVREVALLHACDLAIQEAGHRPDRLTKSRSAAQSHKRQAVMDGARRLYGDYEQD